MLGQQFYFNLNNDLIVDLFAGGGGASTGIELAAGRHVDIAVNHDPEAVAMHEMNHPQAQHFCEDVFTVDPVKVTEGRPVGLLWASPDCKHFSKAKGGKPVSKKIRSLAWVVVKWARLVRPRIICLENVEEFQTWGPLKDDLPDPARGGETFKRWVNALRGLGYSVEWRELRACDYGAPTIRKRLFLVARCDGQPIVWPTPTHGKGLKPYRTAAEIIDWSIPCPSIFEREKPLSENTMRRIAHGIFKFVIKAGGRRVPGLDKMLGTVVSGGDKFASEEVCAFLINYYGTSKSASVNDPLNTCTGNVHSGLVVVKTEGKEYAITDIGLRMLQPHELYAGQGFPENYIFDRGIDEKFLSKTAQIRMCGNSVCPPVAEALVKANYGVIEVKKTA